MAGTQENRPRTTQRRRRKISPLPFVVVCAVIIILISFMFRVDTIEVVGSTVYTPDETKASSNGAVFTAKLDENGMFTELTRMED